MGEKKYKILILEDNPTDVELIHITLKKGGLIFDSKIIENEKDFIAAMKEFAPDLVLADYSLPSFDNFLVLKIINENYPDTPVIFFSGIIGDDLIAMVTKNKNVSDFISKNEIDRLVPAVLRALEKKENNTK